MNRYTLEILAVITSLIVSFTLSWYADVLSANALDSPISSELTPANLRVDGESLHAIARLP
jgi:hypothetical protein